MIARMQGPSAGAFNGARLATGIALMRARDGVSCHCNRHIRLLNG
jgi:hypothetical protein